MTAHSGPSGSKCFSGELAEFGSLNNITLAEGMSFVECGTYSALWTKAIVSELKRRAMQSR